MCPDVQRRNDHRQFIQIRPAENRAQRVCDCGRCAYLVGKRGFVPAPGIRLGSDRICALPAEPVHGGAAAGDELPGDCVLRSGAVPRQPRADLPAGDCAGRRGADFVAAGVPRGQSVCDRRGCVPAGADGRDDQSAVHHRRTGVRRDFLQKHAETLAFGAKI